MDTAALGGPLFWTATRQVPACCHRLAKPMASWALTEEQAYSSTEEQAYSSSETKVMSVGVVGAARGQETTGGGIWV